jgi:mRNA-degrading endonuclease toxin of MazEF toxin-antitoxin module
MTLRPGEVVLIRIEFHQTPGGKLRPAVVLPDSADEDFVAAPITSHLRVSDFDVPIHQWREAGLNTASTIRDQTDSEVRYFDLLSLRKYSATASA